MANIRTIRQSFNGGELTPEFFGRLDDVKNQSGLALMRNFIALPHGPAVNRSGFGYVRTTKDSTKKSRLIPFIYSTGQAYAIELGDGYMRFHQQGATLLAGSVPAWSFPVAYSIGDMVSVSGVNYYCIQAHSGYSPPNYHYWYPLPASGEYEIPTAFLEAELFDIHYVQSNDVLTLVHPNHHPCELRRHGATNWTINDIAFAPNIPAPTSGASAVTTSNTRSIVTQAVYQYKVTSVGSDGTTESLDGGNMYGQVTTLTACTNASPGVFSCSVAPNLMVGMPVRMYAVIFASHTMADATYYVKTISGASITLTDGSGSDVDTSAWGSFVSGAVIAIGVVNDLLVTGNRNRITWNIATGAAYYNVYKESNGLFGFIGRTTNTFFVDDNITADLSRTPQVSQDPFSSAQNYPAAVSYFEQRRCFAGTINAPQSLWMTRSGTESSLSYSIPTRDDDAISIRVAARENNTIRHIVPLGSMVLLTNAAEWRVTSVNSDAITPTSISVRPQSYVGASNAQPVIVNNNLIYAAARGGHVREMAYAFQANGYMTGDLSLRAPHLFDGLTIADMAYAKCPQPVCWFTSSNGSLLGLTYIPEQQVGAWHHHDTDGAFESICVIPEGNEDVLYAVINRTVNGSQRRYVERMASRQFTDQADAFFVDCGLTYSGSPATTISGLGHLEGKTVNILADGAVQPPCIVTSGSITLAQSASKVQVGLPITADIQTMPLAVGVDGGYGQGRAKNINRIWARVYRSGGMMAGPDADHLTVVKPRRDDPYGSPPALRSEEVNLVVSPSWGTDGQLFLRQTDPLPLTLVSLTMEVALGG